MARVDQRVNYYNFSGGKVSDTNPLAPPENVVRTMLNVDIKRDGSVSRRLGLEPEFSFSFLYDIEARATTGDGAFLSGMSLDDLKSAAIDVYVWQGVDFDPELNFVVARIGDVLYIYNPTSESISTSLAYTVDLTPFKTEFAEGDISNSFQAASGKGLLVCSGGYYKPFYIQYNRDTEAWTVAEIEIRVRDFEGVDDNYEVNERPDGPDYNNHNTITARHLYNLLNQGWARWEINEFHYQTGRYGGYGVYPANSDVATIGRAYDAGEGFHANRLTVRPISTGRAPQGHFIIDPFDTTTRGTVAAEEAWATSSFSVGGTVINRRPKSVAFFAGRFFYGSVDGIIYYSQIVEGVDDLGKCYQENDPTSEDFNQLLDTDGGTLKLMSVGTVEKMVPMGNSLIIMGTSGIYVLSGGSDKGFTANNQQIGFLTSVIALGYRSIVQTNGPVLFWSDRGIFAIGSNEIGDPQVKSLSDYRISKDYLRIPMAARIVAQGCFEPIENRVYWSYNQDTTALNDNVINKYTNILVLDLTTGAFWDYELSDEGYVDLDSPYPMMVGSISAPTRVVTEMTETVVDNSDVLVVDDDGEDVYITRYQYGSSNSQHAVAMLIPDVSGLYRFTFGKLTGRTFHDWTRLTAEDQTWNPNHEYADWPEIDITPKGYTSVVETLPATLGEPSVKKQTPYVYTYYQTARDGYPVYTTSDYTPPVTPDPIVRLDGGWWTASTDAPAITPRYYQFSNINNRWEALLSATIDEEIPNDTWTLVTNHLSLVPDIETGVGDWPAQGALGGPIEDRPGYAKFVIGYSSVGSPDETLAYFTIRLYNGGALIGEHVGLSPSSEVGGKFHITVPLSWNDDNEYLSGIVFNSNGTGEVPVHSEWRMPPGTGVFGYGAYDYTVEEITFHFTNPDL